MGEIFSLSAIFCGPLILGNNEQADDAKGMGAVSFETQNAEEKQGEVSQKKTV